jgi:hypothetical protein
LAIITLYKRDEESHEYQGEEIAFNGFAFEWIVENISKGENFAVYDGAICDENEISKTDKMKTSKSVSIVMLPAGTLAIAVVVALVVSAAVVLLTPKPDALGNVNRQQGSPNNELSNRRNRARPNQRIVDFVGESESIPDVIQKEFARYNASKREERIGAYAVGRKRLDIARLRDADNLISDTIGSQAQIYYPFKSPNNSAPDVVVNPNEPLINENVVGVYQSTVAIGQTLKAPAVVTFDIGSNGTIAVDKAGGFAWIIDPDMTYTDYPIGSKIELSDVWIELEPATPSLASANLHLGTSGDLEVSGNAFGQLEFLINLAPEFLEIPLDYTNYAILEEKNANPTGVPPNITILTPEVISPEVFDGDTYKITSVKVDRLLANIYCPNGLYKRSSGDKENVRVGFALAYWRLTKNSLGEYNRSGSLQIVDGELTDKTDDQIGYTIEVDLGAATYIEWYVYRTTFEDVDYNGTVVDVIKLKDLFGLYDIDRTDFGDITMIQTKRTQVEQVTAIANPEVNCIATEMIYKYLGGGTFDTVLTKNTQAMQSLISKALDPKIGRMTVDELDLELLLQTQSEIETYYQNIKAGQCSYSFDSTNTTAQETFTLIANAVSCILWREGRLLKSWFESPQSIPQMVFTHRSKEPNSETWNRNFKQDKDGVSFKYIDEVTYNQEVLIHPPGALNPKTFEVPGIKGIELATWRMKREWNKLVSQRVTVDFTAKEEGRFVKPNRLISVVKGSRVGSTDGYVMNVNALTIELSQEVEFTAGDDHFIIFKKRDGSTQSIQCTETAIKRIVNLLFAPSEALYTGNSALKTEFSFGNEARLSGQLMMPQTIDASEKNSTRISAVNYSDDYYKNDPDQIIQSAFSAGFSNGFF